MGGHRQKRPRFLKFRVREKNAQVAQLVEQGTENPRVAGSIPALGTVLVGEVRWGLRAPGAIKKSRLRLRVLNGGEALAGLVGVGLKGRVLKASPREVAVQLDGSPGAVQPERG
jgi:hypothetical protein